jgi:membrane fusion protein, heavy metal efflux system
MPVLKPSLVALALSGLLFAAAPARAGEGHDHGDAPTAASGNAPKRQADGSVFLPKPSQRQLAIRTVVAESKALPRTVEMAGRVVMDPSAGGKVQPLAGGRIEAGPRGLPVLGQTVKRGEVLARVRSSASPIERANQSSSAAELRAQLQTAERAADRLAQLEGSVPQKEIDAARAEAVALRQRVAAVGGSLNATESLLAPVSGVIASVHVVAGQVVDARELLFEIVDPQRLMVEANAFDASLVGQIAAAGASPGGGIGVPLRFVGAGRTLREGALPLVFRTDIAKGQDVPALAVGQPVTVIVQTKTQVQGVPVTTAAVVKNPSNQDIVWVHTAAETFEPRPVRWTALDGATVSILDGLQAGDRVVVQGAPLVNQVR